MERGRSIINSDSSGQTYILSFQPDIGFCSYFPRIQLLNKIRNENIDRHNVLMHIRA